MKHLSTKTLKNVSLFRIHLLSALEKQKLDLTNRKIKDQVNNLKNGTLKYSKKKLTILFMSN